MWCLPTLSCMTSTYVTVTCVSMHICMVCKAQLQFWQCGVDCIMSLAVSTCQWTRLQPPWTSCTELWLQLHTSVTLLLQYYSAILATQRRSKRLLGSGKATTARCSSDESPDRRIA